MTTLDQALKNQKMQDQASQRCTAQIASGAIGSGAGYGILNQTTAPKREIEVRIQEVDNGYIVYSSDSQNWNRRHMVFGTLNRAISGSVDVLKSLATECDGVGE